jgi:hypothetical protein
VTCSRELACEVVRRLDSAPGHRPDTDKLARTHRRPIDVIDVIDGRRHRAVDIDRQPETIEAQLALGFTSFPPRLRE